MLETSGKLFYLHIPVSSECVKLLQDSNSNLKSIKILIANINLYSSNLNIKSNLYTNVLIAIDSCRSTLSKMALNCLTKYKSEKVQV